MAVGNMFSMMELID